MRSNSPRGKRPRCKDAIKSPCQPSAPLPPWGGSSMKVFAAALIALAFPATAWGEATLVTREFRSSDGALASATAPERFNLVGLHWKAQAVSSCVCGGRPAGAPGGRSRSRGGGPPDCGSRKRAACAAGGSVRSVDGEARRLEVRARGRVSRVRAHYVWSPEEPLGRSLQMAGSPRSSPGRPGAPTNGSAVQPQIRQNR